MKIRYGFVSNSSSSSFMGVVKASEFAKLKKEFDPLCSAILNDLSCGKRKLGNEAYVIMHHYGSSEDELDFDVLAKTLSNPGNEKLIKDLPDILKNVKNPTYKSLYDTVNARIIAGEYDEDKWYELYEYMNEKLCFVQKALKKLEKQHLAILHTLSC